MAWSEEPRNNESDAGALIRRGSQEQADGNLEEAESLFRDAERLLIGALERSETDADAHGDELPILLREMSRLYILQSAYDQAEKPLLRLLSITKANGEDRPEVATVLASLAAVRHSLGDYASSEHLYRQALHIRERSLAPNHVNTAGTMQSLAETCAARGNFAEAVSLCNRALTIRELTLGANDPSLRVARQRIADLQLEAHEEQRISTPSRSVPAQRSSLGHESPVESRPSGASRMPVVLVPWAEELAFVRDEIDATSPAVVEDRAPRRSTRTTATGARSSAAIAGGAAVVVLLVALGFMQFANKPDRNTFAEAEPYNPASRRAVQRVAPSAVPTPALPTHMDTLAVASTKSDVGPVSTPLVSRAKAPNVVARAIPRLQVPAPRVSVAAAPAGKLPAVPVTDSVPPRVAPPAVEKAPETRAREVVNAPTSPTLIGAAPQPQYPEALREQQVEGEVVVQFVVDETGRPDVSSMTVVRSPHVLLTNAVRAMLPQFRYEPARTAPPQSSPRPETVRYAFTFHAARK